MTAFARTTETTTYGQLTWEVRSVNHRYLEINVKLPESFRGAEKAVRDAMAHIMKRGKIDAFLKFQPGEHVPFELKINTGLLQQLHAAQQVVREQFQSVETSLTSLLSWPGVLQTEETHAEEMEKTALLGLKKALREMADMRNREGDGIEKFISERLDDILKQIQLIEKRLPTAQIMMREKIMQRFAELNIEPNIERLEQEMVYLLQKMDVAEELQRLLAHIEEVRRILDKGGVVGRRLDFLMQELNREANTLGSKILDTEITQAVVDVKVQIEQMREQVQNIE